MRVSWGSTCTIHTNILCSYQAIDVATHGTIYAACMYNNIPTWSGTIAKQIDHIVVWQYVFHQLQFLPEIVNLMWRSFTWNREAKSDDRNMDQTLTSQVKSLIPKVPERYLLKALNSRGSFGGAYLLTPLRINVYPH